jgi:hypothetical protein
LEENEQKLAERKYLENKIKLANTYPEGCRLQRSLDVTWGSRGVRGRECYIVAKQLLRYLAIQRKT